MNSIDYSQACHWASCPAVGAEEKKADVFFVHGTVLYYSESGHMHLDNPRHCAMADYSLLSQASLFSPCANIYQPQYRQVSMNGFDQPEAEMLKLLHWACLDVQDAFMYYWQNINQGKRPFFLCGNSQGSIVLIELMKKLLHNDQIYRQMVASYLIGFSVRQEDLDEHHNMHLAQGAQDTGVIITYNTIAKDAEKARTIIPGALCVNPLNWVNTPDYAPRSLHQGAVFFGENAAGGFEERPAYTDAWIDPEHNALKVSTVPAEAASIHFPAGDLHKVNISLFYRNLQTNAQERLAAFMTADNKVSYPEKEG